MKVGLVGFGGSGKTTVFAALTGSEPSAGKASLGTVRVPDARVDRLAEMWNPRKRTRAEVLFEDYAPGSFGAGQGAISAAALADMRTLDVLAEVVDAFGGGDLSGVEQAADAFRTELLLADLAIIEKRLERLKKESGHERERELLDRCRPALEEGTELRRLGLDAAELAALSGFQFLTLKPRLVVANVAEDAAGEAGDDLRERLASEGLDLVVLSAPIEFELTKLDDDERTEFLSDLGLPAAAIDRFIASCYRMLDLITFLTAGEDEVRAWPIRRGTQAVDAAGKIHSDIARGFIRAEVIAYDDYVELGGEAGAKQAGKLKMQGKDYVMADGDVVHFRFNV